MECKEVCILCNEILGENFTIVNTEKGLNAIISKSIKNNDNLHLLLNNVTNIKLHTVCRKEYTYRNLCIKNELQDIKNVRNFTLASSLRSKSKTFDFEHHCVYCGNEASKEKEIKKPQERRTSIHDVETADLQAIKNRCNANIKNDNDILLRISGIIDLKAVRAKYHKNCYVDFQKSHADDQHYHDNNSSQGRPQNMIKLDALKKLCDFIEADPSKQFTLQEITCRLKQFSSGDVYCDRYVLTKLQEHYGDRIVVSVSHSKQTIITLRDKSCDILRESYNERKNTSSLSPNEQKINDVVNIIKNEIKSTQYSMDNYESFDMNSLMELIPPSLKVLLRGLLFDSKNCNLTVIMVAHILICSIRPKSFLSPLLVAVGVWLHKKYGSRFLVDMMSALGACVSYSEVIRFEHSATVATQPKISSDGFLQFIYDNADMNQDTLTGSGTFHCMGGVKIVTPSSAVQQAKQMVRLKLTSQEALKEEEIPIYMYTKPVSHGLCQIKIKNIEIFSLSEKVNKYFHLDVLLISTRLLSNEKFLPWTGFMQSVVHSGENNAEKSSIIYLPFINLSASNPTSIYSALKYSLNETLKHKQTTCFTTFDQPLYEKASDIVAASQPELKGVIVRLGGFHLMFSYVAAISYFMDGSGIADLWETAYAPNSIPHMLAGKAISRALRAHFLTCDSLTRNALQSLLEEDSTLYKSLQAADNTMQNLRSNIITCEEAANSSSVKIITEKIDIFFKKCEMESRTAKLWNQYRKYILLLRLYIISERVGDWNLHLYCVRQMIPVFYAAGHLNYARSAHMYLQTMLSLPHIVQEKELQLFISAGYFTIRRNSKFWSGCWSDLIIEQTLMRSMKASGGLSRGRGTSQSTLLKWTGSMPACMEFSDMLENVVGIKSKTSEQHVDLSLSRQNYNKRHAAAFDEWFKEHPPLKCETSQLVSLSSGIIGDLKINCDNANEVGNILLQQTLNKNTNFGELHLKRKERVLPLSAINNAVKINDNIVVVNHEQIFNRVLCLNLDQSDRIATFSFELAPTCTSLFDKNNSMRIGTKSTLQDIIYKKICNEPIKQINFNAVYVIDGGFLLHKVVWPKPAKIESILEYYIKYIENHYKNARKIIIIFDTYENEASTTKSQAHARRYNMVSRREIIFTHNTVYNGSQSDFLSCSKNKTRLIDMLCTHLQGKSITTIKAEGDADATIASTALQEAECSPVNVIATDTDILVILLQRSSSDYDITMIAPTTNRSKKNDKVFCISKLQDKLGITSKCMMFLHAMSGCDSTSAPYNKGKQAAYDLLLSNVDIQNIALSFNHKFITKEEIKSGGEVFFLALYKSSAQNLNLSRYICYNQLIKNTDIRKQFKINALPPTSDAAAQHSLRAYYQIQKWLGDTSLNPTDYGWKKKNENSLVPIVMTQDPAPDFVLHMISCNCKTDCSSMRCSCKSNNIHCTAMCGRCCGFACSNHEEMQEDEQDEQTNSEMNELTDDEENEIYTTTPQKTRKSKSLNDSPRKRRNVNQ